MKFDNYQGCDEIHTSRGATSHCIACREKHKKSQKCTTHTHSHTQARMHTHTCTRTNARAGSASAPTHTHTLNVKHTDIHTHTPCLNTRMRMTSCKQYYYVTGGENNTPVGPSKRGENERATRSIVKARW